MKKHLFLSALCWCLFASCVGNKTNHQSIHDKFCISNLNYRDFSIGRLIDLYEYVDSSQMVDTCDYIYRPRDGFSTCAEYYYYSIIDTTDYYSYVYYYYAEYVRAFLLVNYDKKGNYIDDVVISSESGDGGYFEYSEGVFLDDSKIIRVDIEGEYAYKDSIDTITNLSKYKIVIQKDGHFVIDTLIYNMVLRKDL